MTSALSVRSAETLRGDQRPRLSSIPKYKYTSGPDAVALAKHAGLELDPWQQLVLIDGLGELQNGQWSAFEVALICPRQSGKGSILEARELAGLFLLEEEMIIHSAHEFKGLDLETPILTTMGWSTMGDLRDGDEVFGPDGQPTKVVAAHPYRRRPCYRLRFDDGQEVVADDEHLWEVVEVSRPGGKGCRRVLTTQQIVDAGISTTWAYSAGRNRRIYHFRTELPQPLTYDEQSLPVAPWLLGAWLGDGDRNTGRLTVGSRDLTYVLARLNALGESYQVHPDPRNTVSTVRVSGLTVRLRALGILGAKHIPDRYFLASEQQRRELLAGIMDTDGTVSAHQIAVTFANARLTDDVASLVRSLGYKASLREFRASLNGADAGPMYRVQYCASTDISPFMMPRKTAKLKPREAKITRAHYNAIVAVDPIESRPTRCITVAHESQMYLVGRGFVPTHNTAAEAFRRVLGLIKSTPDLWAQVKSVRTSHGEEGIELKSGQRLRFVARSTGSGRGFTGDCIILDEAYNLDDRAMAALMPTLSARKNPQLWYTSSAGMPTSIQLGRVRERGIRGDDPGLAFFEWSVDDSDDHDDPYSWAKANPGLGIRISVEYVARERRALSPDAFARERLGIGEYPVEGPDGWSVISQTMWETIQDRQSEPQDPIALAVDVTPGFGAATIAGAGRRRDGTLHVEVIHHYPHTGWVAESLAELVKKWQPCAVVVDAGSPAGTLLPELDEAQISVVTPTMRQVGQACGWFYDAVKQGHLRHMGQYDLNAAIAGAQQRPLGDAWAWNRRGLTTDISPLVAATLAAWGHATFAHHATGNPGVWII